MLWTAFPTAFSAIMTTLYIPLALAALGIVLRGSGFAFRHALPGPVREPASRVFGIASLLTPFFMGTVVGAVASGEVPAGGDGDPTGSWTGFLPLVTGVIFVAARRLHGAGLPGPRLGRGRRPGSAATTSSRRALATRGGRRRRGGRAGVFALHADARYVYDGLTSWPGIALVILSGVCGLAALALLVSGQRDSAGLACRLPAAVGAVVTLIWGYFAAAFPYMLPTSLTISRTPPAPPPR